VEPLPPEEAASAVRQGTTRNRKKPEKLVRILRRAVVPLPPRDNEYFGERVVRRITRGGRQSTKDVSVERYLVDRDELPERVVRSLP
jgi:hypothetical protein